MKFTPESLNKIKEFKEYIQSLFDEEIKINDENLLLKAFIHKSYACDYVWDYVHNERLEFLGDGILWAIINKNLFLNFKNEAESKLTLYKVNLIREKTLAETARDIWLWKYILIWNGEQRQWWDNKDSILSDWIEALIWFLYIDQPTDIVEKFVTKYVYSKINNIKNKQNKSYKSQIQEFIQKKTHQIPEYNTIEHEIDKNNNTTIYKSIIIFEEIEWIWYGKNKKIAEESAAKDILDKIK